MGSLQEEHCTSTQLQPVASCSGFEVYYPAQLVLQCNYHVLVLRCGAFKRWLDHKGSQSWTASVSPQAENSGFLYAPVTLTFIHGWNSQPALKMPAAWYSALQSLGLEMNQWAFIKSSHSAILWTAAGSGPGLWSSSCQPRLSSRQSSALALHFKELVLFSQDDAQGS